MAIQYGFEVEAFYSTDKLRPEIMPELPPKDYPLDGFPGLVELRTSGGKSIYDAFAELKKEHWKLNTKNLFFIPQAVFLPEQKRELRKSYTFAKDVVDVQSLYNKKPRALGNKTIASFQINISNLVRAGYSKEIKDHGKVYYPDEYGLLDIPRIIKALDKEFEFDIKKSGRQPGEYCVKDTYRLEYRSLPNSVYIEYSVEELITKIQACVEPK